MKVLWLTVAPLNEPGYRSTQLGMAAALERLGWSVHLLCKGNPCPPFDGYAGFTGNVSIIPRKNPLWTELRYHLTVWKLILGGNIDVVVFEPPQLRVMLLPALLSWLRLLRQRFVLDVRTPLVEADCSDRVVAFNYRMAMSFSRHFLPGTSVITEELKKDLLPLLGEKKPVGIWASAVDAELFDPARVTGLNHRQRYELGDKTVIFYHGTLSVNRGLRQLVLAMKKLVSSDVPAVLVLLGDGPSRTELQNDVKELQLAHHVLFLDPVTNEEVPGYVAMADIAVIPLPDERCWNVSSPLKLFEYMAMNIPLVVSSIQAHRAVLANAPYAVYAETVTPDGLAAALKKAIRHLPELKTSAETARPLVLAEHTWDSKAAAFSTFLTGVARPGRGGHA